MLHKLAHVLRLVRVHEIIVHQLGPFTCKVKKCRCGRTIKMTVTEQRPNPLAGLAKQQ